MVATYEYDAFGALRSRTGSSAQPFRFTGGQWDSETGFYYLRARYYDPAIGRFVSRDPWPGLVSVPQSLNRYAYVLNNPALYVDPYGYWGLGDVWDKTKDVAGAVGGGIKTGAGATAQVADWARHQAVSAGAWLASCDWKKVAGGATILAGGAVAAGLGGYVVVVGAGAASGAGTALGVAEGLHIAGAGGVMLVGSGALGLASLATFSDTGCGETQGEVVIVPKAPTAVLAQAAPGRPKE